MAAIGELFKNLSKNNIFNEICKKMENGLSNNQVIEEAMNNEELITELKNILDDVNIIKSKMEIIIGQKRKGIEKQKEKLVQNNNTNNNNNKSDQNSEKEIKMNNDEFSFFKNKPQNKNNVTWINDKTYIEQNGLNLKMVYFIEDNEFVMVY